MIKQLAILNALAVIALASCAPNGDNAHLAADRAAIAKDNNAIAEQQNNIAVNRAQKARAKANGDTGAQLKNSLELGANHVAAGAKKLEKGADENIMEQDRDAR